MLSMLLASFTILRGRDPKEIPGVRDRRVVEVLVGDRLLDLLRRDVVQSLSPCEFPTRWATMRGGDLGPAADDEHRLRRMRLGGRAAAHREISDADVRPMCIGLLHCGCALALDSASSDSYQCEPWARPPLRPWGFVLDQTVRSGRLRKSGRVRIFPSRRQPSGRLALHGTESRGLQGCADTRSSIKGLELAKENCHVGRLNFLSRASPDSELRPPNNRPTHVTLQNCLASQKLDNNCSAK